MNEFAVEIGEERILDADADHIDVTVSAADQAKDAQQRFTANPLWDQLTGEVFVVAVSGELSAEAEQAGTRGGTAAELRQSRQNSLPSGSVITMKPALIGGAGS